MYLNALVSDQYLVSADMQSPGPRKGKMVSDHLYPNYLKQQKQRHDFT